MVDVEHVYERSPLAQLCNRIVEEVIATAAESLSSLPGDLPDRVLRVLEIGAGTGGTTGSVLRGLPGKPYRLRILRTFPVCSWRRPPISFPPFPLFASSCSTLNAIPKRRVFRGTLSIWSWRQMSCTRR